MGAKGRSRRKGRKAHSEERVPAWAKGIQRAVHSMSIQVGQLAQAASLQKIAADVPKNPIWEEAGLRMVRKDELPLWMTAREISRKIGIPEQRLRRLSNDGYVRKTKFGNSRQSGVRFNRDDLLEAIDLISRGKMPRKK